jgi:hypothetical protein
MSLITEQLGYSVRVSRRRERSGGKRRDKHSEQAGQ